MFNDSIEGIVPRKKIRVRFYGDFKKIIEKNLKLEIKYTNPSGRAKITEGIKNFSKLIKLGYLDSLYGVCYPKLIVSYKRSYFQIDKLRITYDENISYSEFKTNFNKLIFTKDDSIIFEVKTNNFKAQDLINQKIPFKTIRFSKYSNGIEKLQLNKFIL